MEILGDYTIQKPLGAGAFGVVYLAEHRFIKRLFALKVLPEEVCNDPAFVRRFETRVAEIAALEHPHISKIHNVSCHDGHYFVVTDPVIDSMEEAMHLDRFLQLKGKSLSEGEIEELLKQIASALDYAHEKGIVHGSLKLSNILVVGAEKGYKLLLTDFGLNRLIGEGTCFLRLCEHISRALAPSASFNAEKAIQTGRNFVRSFAFLAPEQKGLEAAPADQKVDVYAFGVLAYFMLMKKIPEGCFDLPSQTLPDLHLNWDLLLNRCLQHNPNARPQRLLLSMAEFLHAPKTTPQATEEPKQDTQQITFEFQAKAEAARVAVQEAQQLKPLIKPPEITRPEYEPDPAAAFQREMLVSHYEPKKNEIKESEPIGTDMIVVPGGSYMRGSNEGARDEMPRHEVRLNSFALDIHPITNEQFIRFLQAMGGEKDQHNNDIIRLRDSRIKRSGGKLIIESGYGRHPVVGVTWYGAIAYAKWIGKRLPTEAEWEAAATTGRDTIYPTGAEIERTQANFFSSDTTPVMSYPPNSFGLFDMAGNVYEWCQDWYAYNFYDSSLVEPDNPAGPHQGVYRVLRGGCWKSLKEDLRCSHRHRNNPGAVNGTYGFRCAADVAKE